MTPREGRAPRLHRAAELAAIGGAAVLTGILGARLVVALDHPAQWATAAGAALAGYVAADLLSGLAHWLFDTWGSEDTPVLGASFIRPFREHHVDERAITRHDFVETNGNNCLAALPVLGAACAIPTGSSAGLFWMAFLLSTSLAVLATNQIHKWAHLDEPGVLVRRLHRWHIVLPAEHHRAHHDSPHETRYCITTGWLNRGLEAMDLFRRLERLITALTGALPRSYRVGAAGGPARHGDRRLEP